MSESHATGSWEDAVRSLMNEPAQRQLVLDCFYDEPRTAAADRYARSPEWQATLGLLPKQPGRALEIGAGHGIASCALARAGWQVTALEPDPSELVGAGAIRRLAAECGLTIRVVEAFGEQLPFADGEFDLVLARQVLHHARNLPQLCREIARVVRPGGTVLAMREHVISKRSDLQKFFEVHPLHHLYGGENAYLREEYVAALESAGLEINRCLAPFDSAINYAPYTRESLREELIARAGRIPGAATLLRGLLGSDAGYDAFLRLLSRLDRRPGRLYSFLCTRPVTT
jgi:SAM-dependent methyltransferase